MQHQKWFFYVYIKEGTQTVFSSETRLFKFKVKHANSATATAEQKNSSFEFLQIFFSFLNQLSFQEVLKWWWKNKPSIPQCQSKDISVVYYTGIWNHLINNWSLPSLFLLRIQKLNSGQAGIDVAKTKIEKVSICSKSVEFIHNKIKQKITFSWVTKLFWEMSHLRALVVSDNLRT